jgi:hypothetical protein
MQDQFVEHYENSHAPLARSILEFSHYERNHILNLSTGDPSCISIFKYSSEELLKKTQKILQDYPKELKEDELKFMDFDKNYYHFVDEKISSLKKFKYKVFSKNEIHNDQLHEISVNKIIDQESTIFEYGSELDLSAQYNTKSVYFCKNYS